MGVKEVNSLFYFQFCVERPSLNLYVNTHKGSLYVKFAYQSNTKHGSEYNLHAIIQLKCFSSFLFPFLKQFSFFQWQIIAWQLKLALLTYCSFKTQKTTSEKTTLIFYKAMLNILKFVSITNKSICTLQHSTIPCLPSNSAIAPPSRLSIFPALPLW